jgi:actin-related protein
MELLQAFLNHGYQSALRQSDLSSHPLMLVERSYNPPPIRQQLLQVMFEEQGVPALFLARDAALACFGCGRVTGTVVDLGYSGTTVSPVYDGYVEAKGIRRSPVGLQAVDEYILQQMDRLYGAGIAARKKRGSSASAAAAVIPALYQVREPGVVRAMDIYHAARMHLAADCRESGAGASVNTALLGSGGSGPGGGPAVAAAGAGGAQATTFHAPHKSYELPDGTVLDIPSSSRFSAAAYLFGGTEPSATAASGGSGGGGSSDSSGTMQRREERLQSTRTAMAEMIAKWKESDSEDNEGEGDDSGRGDRSERGSGGGKSTGGGGGEFTEEAAVGISKRRGKRDPATQAADPVPPPPQRRFNHSLLQRACLPYYQTHLDQYLTAAPVPSMICDAAYKCDRDQQVALLGNIVLGGGGACLGPTEQAVPDCIRESLEALIHTHTPGWRVKLLSPGAQERSVLSWLGGSILGSMGTFHDMWITKAEYEEWGTAIVNRKSP